jgi:hypothetical protein
VCRTALWGDVREPFGQKRCPRCGAELWVLDFSAGPAFFSRLPGESLHDFLTDLAGPESDLSATDIEAALKGADSFDVLEFLSELEAAARLGSQ